MFKIDIMLEANTETGLLMITVALQQPATAADESTITTLSDDATLHEEAATAQTLAEQL